MNNVKHSWIIYHEKDIEKNKWFIDSFINKSKNYKIDMKLISVEYILSHKNDIDRWPDFVLARMINPGLTLFLEEKGVKVLNNSKVSIISNNKANAIRFVHDKNICHIPTFVFSENEKHKLVLEDYIGCDNLKTDTSEYIVKSVTGHGGKEVYTLSEFLEMDEFHPMECNAWNYYPEKYIIQPYIPCNGRDLRVYVIGGRIVGAVLRTSSSGFKSNYSLGGNVRLYKLNEKQIETVNTIIKELEADYIGIDFLVMDDDSIIFNEIEDVVGARMLSECSDIDYIDIYLQHIVKIIK